MLFRNTIIITYQNILTFFDVMLLSGNHSLPHRRFYWSRDPDVHFDLVPNAICRNSFHKFIAYVLSNEANDGSDKPYKMRRLFDMLNASFKQVQDHT